MSLPRFDYVEVELLEKLKNRLEKIGSHIIEPINSIKVADTNFDNTSADTIYPKTLNIKYQLMQLTKADWIDIINNVLKNL